VRTQFNGIGTINGAGEYSFFVTAIDVKNPGVDDSFRIKIWNKMTGDVIYDNLPDLADVAHPIALLKGGS